MYRLIVFFALFALVTSTHVWAQSAEVTRQNKTLFDQTVEKVNFRTIEFVYDRKYPRKKFPASQNTFKTRKTFDDFEGDARFKQLFLNYNDVAEKFKNNFGKGKNDLASFEKALSDILINKDFEFFISRLNKDDKIQLIRSLQQINKKGIAQFVDAAGKPRGFFASDSVSSESQDPIVKPKNQAAVQTDTGRAVINTDATPEEVFQEKTPRRDWLTWLSMIMSIAALALAASIKLKDVPELRAYFASNYQKRGDGPASSKTAATSATDGPADPLLKKQLDNLTREVEGLYAQMDDLLHKNTVLEQKLAASHPRPFDLPKAAVVALPEPEEAPAPAKPVKPISPELPDEAETLTREDLQPTPQSIEETTSAPAQETEPTLPTYYLSKPDRHGFFWNDEVTRNFTPNRSLFVLTHPGNDSRKGSFELVTDAAQQRLALENPELYLSPVCELLGDPATGKRLETASPGAIILNGDQWVLVRKAKIQVV